MTRRTAQNTVRRFFVIIRYFADEPAEENIVPLYHTAIARRSDSEALSELPRNPDTRTPMDNTAPEKPGETYNLVDLMTLPAINDV